MAKWWMVARQIVSDRDGTFISDLNTAITATDGTDGRDYYQIHGGDDIVVSTDGSDETILDLMLVKGTIPRAYITQLPMESHTRA